jgi:hypothetical protein
MRRHGCADIALEEGTRLAVWDIDGAHVREAELPVELVEPSVVLGAVEAKPEPTSVGDETGCVVDEKGSEPAAGVSPCDSEAMQIAGADAPGIVVPEVGVSVVVEGEGTNWRGVLVGDVQLAEVDALSEVCEHELVRPLVGDGLASEPGSGLVEQAGDGWEVLGERGADVEQAWSTDAH